MSARPKAGLWASLQRGALKLATSKSIEAAAPTAPTSTPSATRPPTRSGCLERSTAAVTHSEGTTAKAHVTAKADDRAIDPFGVPENPKWLANGSGR